MARFYLLRHSSRIRLKNMTRRSVVYTLLCLKSHPAANRMRQDHLRQRVLGSSFTSLERGWLIWWSRMVGRCLVYTNRNTRARYADTKRSLGCLPLLGILYDLRDDDPPVQTQPWQGTTGTRQPKDLSQRVYCTVHSFQGQRGSPSSHDPVCFGELCRVSYSLYRQLLFYKHTPLLHPQPESPSSPTDHAPARSHESHRFKTELWTSRPSHLLLDLCRLHHAVRSSFATHLLKSSLLISPPILVPASPGDSILITFSAPFIKSIYFLTEGTSVNFGSFGGCSPQFCLMSTEGYE